MEIDNDESSVYGEQRIPLVSFDSKVRPTNGIIVRCPMDPPIGKSRVLTIHNTMYTLFMM